MRRKLSWVFLMLILFQGMHSIEEYIGELWEVFPPATWLCGQISEDLRLSFLIINSGLFLFGVISWLLVHFHDGSLVKTLIWFWIILGGLNGMGHVVWTISSKSYTPGLITAMAMIALVIVLFKSMIRSPSR